MYPEFRQGEIWDEIKNELRVLGIKPTSDDNTWLESCATNGFELREQTIKN
jgi:hypothetical protein